MVKLKQYEQGYKPDLLVAGGSLGGYAAAWAALRMGLSVVITEEGDRLGGQVTAQAVPPDEHPWVEKFGSTLSYRRFRSMVRDYYRTFYPLTTEASCEEYLNPGRGFVSALCHEPRISQAVLDANFMPYQSSGRLTILLNTVPQSAQVDNNLIKQVAFKDSLGRIISVEPKAVIDATELGDLLPLTGTDFTIGSEAQSQTGELHAQAKANPLNQQAISWCFAISYNPKGDYTIDKPNNYDFWKDYVPPLTPQWGGKLLSWQATHPITMDPVVRSFDPLHPLPERGPMDLWTFRRIACKENFKPGFLQSDIVLVNWPQIDYLLGPVVGVSPKEKQKHLNGARELSLAMLYWMQTDAPREDGKTGWPGLYLRDDITGTKDGLAAAPYIRESRRIKGMFTVLEEHVGLEMRLLQTKLPKEEVKAAEFSDSVGIGAYRIDLHPTVSGDNYVDISSLPFQIPLGAMVPRETKNLLAGCKNISTTHITNGCYRLHPVEWNIGEAAGLCAVLSLLKGVSFQDICSNADLVKDLQSILTKEGVELSWPRISPL